MPSTLPVTRDQVVRFRLRSTDLAGRLPRSAASLRRAARAGLTDSMPRAAVLSLHARVGDIGLEVLDEPVLAQVWGPRFSAYVVAENDAWVFTLGRHPESQAGRRRAEDVAARLADLLGDDEVPGADAGKALGVHPNYIRYATTTGTVRIRWDGAHRPTVRCVPPPDVDPADARRELARRYLHALGPGTPDGFGAWAGVKASAAGRVFGELAGEIVPVTSPAGDGWALAADEEDLRGVADDARPVRLLPSGDVLYLIWGPDRDVLVTDPELRSRLWTSRVWPGAILVGTEVVGTWRRSAHRLTLQPWHGLEPGTRAAIEAEAATLPLPVDRDLVVGWED